MDPTYPLVPMVNIIAAFLVMLSLLSRSIPQAWNAGILMLGCWLFAYSIVIGVDTIQWADNANNPAPIWCDIAIHIQVGANVGVPACSLILTRRLYKIISRRTVGPLSRREATYELAVDVSLGLGFPTLIMALYYIVQLERFAIFEELGCAAVTCTSGASMLITLPWQALFPLISVFLYTKLLWLFLREKREINSILQSNTTMHRSNFFRILAIGCLDTIITLPLGILNITRSVLQTINNATTGLPFWPGWSAIHDDWEPVQLLASEWKTDKWNELSIRLLMWKNAPLALVYFLIFGLTGEARATYRRMFWTAVRPFHWVPPSPPELGSMAFTPGQVRGGTIQST
ncbi:GPCR fungal pheromone mating factor [Amylostereum chailletii]|nr:GPCR fungal pheromone mating factor [Amylostereum chailletii]